MSTSIDSLRADWQSLAATPTATVGMIERAIHAMELAHTQYLDEQAPVAARLSVLAQEMGRSDLALRARLIGVSIELVDGTPLEAARQIEAIVPAAEQLGDRYVLARMHYLQAWVSYFIDDEAGCQVHATRSINLLPDDAPIEVRIDHLGAMGIAFPDDLTFYEEALRLAIEAGDSLRVLTVHNNIAFSSLESGALESALPHVEGLLAESARSGTPLKAVHVDTVARARIEAGDFAAAIEVMEPIRRAAAAIQNGDGTAAGFGASPEIGQGSSYFAEPHALPGGLLTLAEAYRKLGQWDLAQQTLDLAGSLITERGLKLIRPGYLQEQARLQADRGDFEAAYHSYVTFHEVAEKQRTADQHARALLMQATSEADRTRKDAERYRDLAMRDPLTGLYNRRYLTEMVNGEIPRAQQEGAPLSLAIIDADFFKQINDQLSHDIGDKVLQDMARIMVDTRPEGSTVCRLGGEEFVIVLPRANEDDAFGTCEAVRRAIADHEWAPLTGTVPVAVSIGVTTALGGHTSMAALLADADRNLYAAKRSGRNRVMGDAR